MVQLLDGAHVAGRLVSNLDVPPCVSSLIAVPFRRPISLVSLEVVAMAAGAGRRGEGLVVVTFLGEVGVRRAHFSPLSASATNRVPVTPFLTPASSWSAVGGCFLVVLTVLVASTETAASFAFRVVVWWKSSCEHDRAGVLQKAKANYNILLPGYHPISSHSIPLEEPK